MRLVAVVALSAALALPVSAAESEDPWSDARRTMVRVVQLIAEDAGPVGGRPGIAADVLDVMGRTPRHEFVPEERRALAYDDRPLPIGYGQTISQPYIVALMTDLLRLDGDEVVLEIGTGSGYQAAVLAPLARRVHTIEIVPGLATAAAELLDRLGYANVEARQGDGYYGWPEAAPFDALVVTAAAGHGPPPLVQQLKPGGRMVIPVGGPFFVQQLMLVEKAEDGSVTARQLLPVRFVPLTGGP